MDTNWSRSVIHSWCCRMKFLSLSDPPLLQSFGLDYLSMSCLQHLCVRGTLNRNTHPFCHFLLFLLRWDVPKFYCISYWYQISSHLLFYFEDGYASNCFDPFIFLLSNLFEFESVNCCVSVFYGIIMAFCYDRDHELDCLISIGPINLSDSKNLLILGSSSLPQGFNDTNLSILTLPVKTVAKQILTQRFIQMNPNPWTSLRPLLQYQV